MDVAAYMEGARNTSQGVMPLWVLFKTKDEVKAAREWMKGKKKVKTLIPMTHEESEKRHAEARAKILKDTSTGKKK